MPEDKRFPGRDIIGRRSIEYLEHVDRWNFLLDSLEGGNRYRFASYGVYPYEVRYERVVSGATEERNRKVTDLYRANVRRHNLIRHPREYPDPREGSNAAVDPYELRRERTAVPKQVEAAIERHLSRVYSQEVGRDGPEALKDWWEDVDGCGTSIDDWMANEVAPLFLALGQIDLCFDHPQAEDAPRTRADEIRLGVNKCVATYYLPENVLWWKLDKQRRYEEVLVREVVEPGADVKTKFGELESTWNYRHWRPDGWTLYDPDGKEIASGKYNYGRPPIVRLFDRRKPRCRNVGQSRYEAIAERQREIYNLASEQILANTTQAHPILQGPEKYLAGDSTIPIGPDRILPMYQDKDGRAVAEWKIVDFPKTGVEYIERTISDYRDECDKDAALTKPQGSRAESALAKAFDFREGNDLLSRISRCLQKVERAAAEMAVMVLKDGGLVSEAEAEEEPPSVTYPSKFDLQTADEVAAVLSRLQQLAMGAGSLPEIEGEFLKYIVRLSLPGRTDEEYREFDEEIESWLEKASATAAMRIIVPPGSPGVLGPGGGGIGDRGGTNIVPPSPEATPPPDLGSDES